MHEMSIAQNILEIIDETLKNGDHQRLTEVVVDVGELVAVVPDSLQFCYEALTENTRYESSRLTINILPVKARCAECGTESEVRQFTFYCPECNSTKLEVFQGNELHIRHLEVE